MNSETTLQAPVALQRWTSLVKNICPIPVFMDVV